MEFAGNACVALSSKLFVVSRADSAKGARKGLPKRALFNNPHEEFYTCLSGPTQGMSLKHTSIQHGKNAMCTHTGTRTVTNKCDKRQVDAHNNTHTKQRPLHLQSTTQNHTYTLNRSACKRKLSLQSS